MLKRFATHGEFVNMMTERAQGHPVPYYGALEITHCCNLRCAHCYLPEPARSGIKEFSPLDGKEICDLLDQMAAEGCVWLLITGGEPLLHPDFRNIYLGALQRGFVTTLFTNGTLITENVARLFVTYKPFLVEITLYGASPETYERVTGRAEWFEQTLRGINLLIQYGVRVRLKTMVLSLNVHELEAMKRIAARAGVPFRWDGTIIARLNGNHAPCGIRLEPRQLVQLELEDRQRSLAWAERKLSDATSEPFRLYHCQAGETAFAVDEYGHLFLCLNARKPSYDLRCGTFKEGFRKFLQNVRLKPAPNHFRCQGCELISLCRYCPGRFWLETGDENVPAAWHCETGRLMLERLVNGGYLSRHEENGQRVYSRSHAYDNACNLQSGNL